MFYNVKKTATWKYNKNISGMFCFKNWKYLKTGYDKQVFSFQVLKTENGFEKLQTNRTKMLTWWPKERMTYGSLDITSRTARCLPFTTVTLINPTNSTIPAYNSQREQQNKIFRIRGKKSLQQLVFNKSQNSKAHVEE